MDEEEAVRTYSPPRENAENGIKISVKQADKNLLSAIKDNAKPKEHTLGGLNKWKWAEIVIAVFVTGVVAFIEFLFSALMLNLANLIN